MKTEKILSWILLIVMAAAALLYGAYRGWKTEYAHVNELSASLSDAYTACQETAHNLLTVARRHLPEDQEAFQACQLDETALSGQDISGRSAASRKLTQDAQALLSALSVLSSVQQDDRDLMYVTQLLPQMLDSSADLIQAEEKAYTEAAREYNDHFDRYFVSSFLARLFGFDKAPDLTQTVPGGAL